MYGFRSALTRAESDQDFRQAVREVYRLNLQKFPQHCGEYPCFWASYRAQADGKAGRKVELDLNGLVLPDVED